MSVTPEDALRQAQAYVTLHLPGRTVLRLLEDQQDYLVVVNTPDGVQFGEGVIFIAKYDGRLRLEPLVLQMTKTSQMTPVAP